MKRFLALVLAVVMTVLPVMANASVAELAGENSYSFSDAAGEAGDKITIDITLVVGEDFNTIGVNGIEYDEDYLTFVKGTVNGEFKDLCIMSRFDKNKMSLVAGIDPDQAQSEYNGVICTLEFTINDDAPVGETEITVKETELKNGSVVIDHSVDTAVVTVIGKDFPTIKLNDKTVTYNGEEQKHTGIEVSGELPEGASIKYTIDGDEGRSARDAGEYEIEAVVTAPGYNKVTKNATFTVKPAPLTVTAENLSKVYDGTADLLEEVELIYTGLVEGDDVAYDEDASTIAYASKNAGTQTAVFDIELVGDDVDNYNVTFKAPTATIKAKTIYITAKSYTVPVGAEMPVLEYEVEGLVGDDTIVSGSLKCDIKNTNKVAEKPINNNKLSAGSNYTVEFTAGTFKVVNAFTQGIEITGVPSKVTYGDEGFTLVLTYGENVNENAETVVSIGDTVVEGENNKYYIPVNKAGSFNITVTREGDGELIADFNKVIPVTVNKKTVKVTAVNAGKLFGNDDPSEFEYTYDEEDLVGDDEFTGSLERVAGEKVGTYDIRIGTLTLGDNYTIDFTKGTFTISPKADQEVEIETDKYIMTYGMRDFELDVTVGKGSTYSVKYESDNKAVADVDKNGVVTIIGAGTANISVTKKGDYQYADFEGTVKVTIEKKKLTVTAKSYTVPKDGTLPSVLEYDVEGLVNGDAKEDVFTGALKTAATNANTVKNYDILVGTLKPNGNYTVETFNKGTLSVVNAFAQGIEIAGVPEKVTYGDEGFTLVLTYGENVNENAETVVSIGDTVIEGENNEYYIPVNKAGSFNITVTREGDDNLIADFNKVIPVTVNKKTVAVTAISTGKRVGNEDPALEYTYNAEDLVAGDAFTGELAREKGENVGKYDIKIGTLTLGDNYTIDFTEGVFTIYAKTPQNVTIGTPVFNKTYGDGEFELDVTVGDTDVTDSEIDYDSDNKAVATVDGKKVTIVGAGTAKISITKAGDNDYEDVNETVTVKVAKRAIKVIPDDVSKYVGQEDPELTYTYEGELVGDDAFEGALTRASGETAGNKEIKLGTLTLGNNYTITLATGKKYLVIKKLEDQKITIAGFEGVTYGDTGLMVVLTKGEYNSDVAPKFASSNENVATVDDNGNITVVGAGKTTITVTNDGNYKFNSYTGTTVLNVAKKDLVITIANQTKRVGTNDPEFTYTVEGLVDGDEVTGAPERKTGENIGTYAITKGTIAVSAPANYNVKINTDAKLTITDKDTQTLTVAGAPAEPVAYGSEGFALTVSTDAEIAQPEYTFASSDENVVSVDAEGKVTIVGVGTAVITVTVAETEVYASDDETVNVTVSAKDITVSAVDLTEKTVAIEGVLDADKDFVAVDFAKVNVTVTPESNPVTYDVTNFVLTGEKASNYNVTTESFLYTPEESEEIALAVVTVVAENGTVEGAGSYLVGTKVTLTATANSNYKFSGWYIGEEKVGAESTYTFVLDTDVELVAKFSRSSQGGGGFVGGSATRSVYFVSGDEKVKVVVDKGGKLVKPEDPTREGYIFEGWYADAEFTTPYDFDAEVSDSFTLYAKFVEAESGDDSGEGTGEGEGEGTQTTDWKNNFADVEEDDWYYEAVKFASENNLFKGITETAFAPTANLSRAMLVTVLYRAANEPETEGASAFEDVSESAYYADAVAWASENEIVKGFDEDTFAPEELITREQFAVIIFRYAVAKGLVAVNTAENLGFNDVDDISDYAITALNWAVGEEIITGYEDATVRPQNNATRAEAAAILQRFLSKTAE